ncbi:MAG: hypothetical protein RBR09_09010 [Desulfobulbaceae bacterium]|jgi:hypothetical protein|nr:hypothetical protein [Desulfobulbaceae bacterium]MDY0351379.1 hypothetical protein [Desulfobulbaceae bacterium]
MHRFFRSITIPLLTMLLLLQSGQAWALQPHGGGEGLYIHQMAHVFFMGTLTYLYLHTRRTQDPVSRGWRYLRLFCVLFFFWNLMAIIGHATALHLPSEYFINPGTWGERLAPPLSTRKIVYFVSKMDHFLTVPALAALFFSMRSFYREAREEAAK